MSNMLVSLLLKVRTEGVGLITKMHEGLQRLRTDDQLGERIGASMAWGMRQGTVEARGLIGALAEARKRGGELYSTVVHGALGVAVMGAAFKKGFLDIAVEAEQAQIRLQAIEETPGRAEAAMALTAAFRDKTAFALADVRQAYIELRTHGIRPTEYAMTAVADAATAGGLKMAQAARAVGEAIDNGSYRALSELGIEAKKVGTQLVLQYRYLGKVITEALPQANKLQAQQKILEILEKMRGGAAADARQGYAGTLMAMDEQWNRFALDVMTKGGVFEFLKQKLREFAAAGKEIADGQADNTKAVADTFKEIIGGTFMVAGFVRANLPAAIEAVKSFTQAVGGAKVVVGGILAVLAAPFAVSLIGVLGPVLGLMASGAAFLSGVLASLAIVLVTTVIPAIYSLGVALLTTPVGWIVMGIAALIAAAWLLYENWDQVVAFLASLWDGMKATAGEAWQAITDRAGEVVAAVMQKWEAVRGFFRQLFDQIKGWWDDTFGAISRGANWLRDHLPSMPNITLPWSSTSPAEGGKGKAVDGKLKVDISVDSQGRASGRVSESTATGIVLDPTLGFSMGF